MRGFYIILRAGMKGLIAVLKHSLILVHALTIRNAKKKKVVMEYIFATICGRKFFFLCSLLVIIGCCSVNKIVKSESHYAFLLRALCLDSLSYKVVAPPRLMCYLPPSWLDS